jgi:catechol 2,3-dioxygenase-like lactoylglutathione lyase family enzyme
LPDPTDSRRAAEIDRVDRGEVDDRAMRARLHHLVLDCPDPRALAGFYARLLDQSITYDGDDFVVVSPNDRTSGLAFQRSAQHRPPTWPDPRVPQQMHVDVMVEDVDAAREWVVQLGATQLDGDVYADPAGHPFCLIRRPHWAPELEAPPSVGVPSSSAR